MNLEQKYINQIIRNRRSIYPQFYTQQEIEADVLNQILENANWAPTHKLTQPWRFIIFRGATRKTLGHYLATAYKKNTPPDKFSELKYNKKLKKTLQSNCIIAICMERDSKKQIPEWEEIAAVACAVQNMQLTCSAYGIGCYWSTPKAIIEAAEFLQLPKGQKCLGLLYMGYHEAPEMTGTRDDVTEKTRYFQKQFTAF